MNKHLHFLLHEIAKANVSDQFVFYVAVPDLHKELFERQMISVFHNARLSEITSEDPVINESFSIAYFERSNNFLITTSSKDILTDSANALSKIKNLKVDPNFLDLRYDYEERASQPAPDESVHLGD